MCTRLLAGGLVEGDFPGSVPGSNGCGIAAPVLLKAIRLPDGAKVMIDPPAVMRCSLAAALAEWVRNDVVAAIPTPAGRLIRIEAAGAYECRGRNRIGGAVLSEHGKGNALDMRAYVTGSGQRFEISNQTAAAEFFEALKNSACTRFMTVLGPGSDGFHEDHMHVDLQPRTGGSHYCKWRIN